MERNNKASKPNNKVSPNDKLKELKCSISCCTFLSLHQLQAQALSGKPAKLCVEGKNCNAKNSKVVFVAAVSHLNVDVHALFPGNFVKAQGLSDNVLQLELGLVRGDQKVLAVG